MNFINLWDIPAIVVWVVALGIYQYLPISAIRVLLIVLSSLLALAYSTQGRFAFQIMEKESFVVRAFSVFYGYSSSILALGVLFKVMHYPGASFMSNLGMAGVLVVCVLLFHTPIQNAYLPVLKKILLRAALLIAMGFILAFVPAN